MQNKNEVGHEHEEIFSKVLRAGRRTYFFDVRETKAGDYYLTITESKKKIEENKKKPQGTGRRKVKGGVLRYPYEALTANTDYLQIDIVEYKPVGQKPGDLISNPSSGNRRLTSSAAVGSTRPRGLSKSALINAGSILLPIPNSVQDGNSVDVGSSKLGNVIATAASATKDLMDVKPGDKDYMDKMGNVIMKRSGEAGEGVGDFQKASDLLKKQLAANALSSFGGNITLDQMMARQNGEVFNPNMELLFNGPTSVSYTHLTLPTICSV